MTTVFVSNWPELKEAVTNPLDEELEIILENDVLFEEAGPLTIKPGCQFIIKTDSMSCKPFTLEIQSHLKHRHFNILGALCLDHVILDGGGLYLDGGYVNLATGSIIQNGHQPDGGAAYIKNDGRLDMMTGAKITHNTAENAGGGVHIHHGTFVMEGGCIQHNQAQIGGALYNNGTATLKNDSLLQFNEARRGGAIYNHLTLNLTHQAALLENQAFEGGGIFNLGRCQLKDGIKIGQNLATSGAGLYHGDGRVLMIGQPVISENTAKERGGGLYMTVFETELGQIWHRSLWIGGAIFQGNVAKKGGGLYLKDSEVPISIELEEVEFLENKADYGGALYLDLKGGGNRAIGVDSSLLFQHNHAREVFECLRPDATPIPKSLYPALDNHHIWVSREGELPIMGPLQSFEEVFPDEALAIHLAELGNLSVTDIVWQQELDKLYELDISLLEIRDLTGIQRLRRLVNLRIREEQLPLLEDFEDVPNLIMADVGINDNRFKPNWFQRLFKR